MTLDTLLALVEHPRKTGKGWTARCPSHADKHPSLSIREGERGVLLYCFGGCTLDEICGALGITVADLFSDKRDAPSRRASLTEPRRPTFRDLEYLAWVRATAHDLRGLRTLDFAHGLDTSEWTDGDFDRAMVAVGRGYADLRAAEHLHVLAFGLRERIQKGDVDATEAIPGCRPTAERDLGAARTTTDSTGDRGQHRAA